MVGLYKIIGVTRVFEEDSIVVQKDEDNLDYWYIIPSGIGYKVCHTEESEIQYFDAQFLSLGDGLYNYSTEYYSSKEKTTAYAEQFDDRNPQMNGCIIYDLEVPREKAQQLGVLDHHCLLYTSPSPRDATLSRMPSSA